MEQSLMQARNFNRPNKTILKTYRSQYDQQKLYYLPQHSNLKNT